MNQKFTFFYLEQKNSSWFELNKATFETHKTAFFNFTFFN